MESRPLALITGASSGIGADFAQLFAAEGWDLVLVARTEKKLRELAATLEKERAIRAHVITADLSRPGAATALDAELERRGLAVDALINNAGYATYGRFAELDTGSELEMIQVNIVALTELTKRILPRMIARGRGRILNVASTAAFQPGPLMAVYYATKAYVLSLSEALANEAQGTGVTVTALCPGPTQTGFQQRAKMEESKLVAGKKIMTSAEVVKRGYQAMMKGRTVVIPGFKNRLLAQSVRFLPRNTVTRIVRDTQERVAR